MSWTAFSQQTDTVKYHCYTKAQNKFIEKQFFLIADLQHNASDQTKIIQDMSGQVQQRNNQLSADTIIQKNTSEQIVLLNASNYELQSRLNKASKIIKQEKIEKYSIGGIGLAIIGYLLFSHH